MEKSMWVAGDLYLHKYGVSALMGGRLMKVMVVYFDGVMGTEDGYFAHVREVEDWLINPDSTPESVSSHILSHWKVEKVNWKEEGF